MKTDLFQSCGHCWVFHICWHIECSTFTASSFRIWKSSTGIPSPPLSLLVVSCCCCSVAKLCLTLCSPMDCSKPGFPVHHRLLEFAQTHVHWVEWCHPITSSSVTPFSSRLQPFPASGSFPVSWLFTSGDQRNGASASASVLLVHIQGWSPLGLTGWLSLQSKGLSRVFSNTAVRKHQFFVTQLSLVQHD